MRVDVWSCIMPREGRSYGPVVHLCDRCLASSEGQGRRVRRTERPCDECGAVSILAPVLGLTYRSFARCEYDGDEVSHRSHRTDSVHVGSNVTRRRHRTSLWTV